MITTKGSRSKEGLTPKEMELIEITRKIGSWKRYPIHLTEHWHTSTIYKLSKSLVVKGFLKEDGGSYSLGEKANLVRSYRILSSDISVPLGDVRIRTMNVNKKSLAEYKTSDGYTGPIGYGTPNWFSRKANQGTVLFRRVEGTPILDITFHKVASRPY